MITKWAGVLVVLLSAALYAGAAQACSVSFISSPEELVGNAELILRATAVDYLGLPPGNIRTTGVAPTTVRFHVDAVLKGTYASPDIMLNGYLDERDDWNDHPLPYTFVRPNGRSGSCYSNTYRSGGQFVLMLKHVTDPHQGAAEYTVNWAALAPANEQIRSADDPWVQWVTAQIQTQSANTFYVSLRSGSQQYTVNDPSKLEEIRKRMMEIDFWNADKFRRVFSVQRDATCAAQDLERIEITAVLGKPKTLSFVNASCATAEDSATFQEILSLVELIRRAVPAKP